MLLFNSLVTKVKFIIKLFNLLHVNISDSFKSSKSYFSSQLTNSVTLTELVIIIIIIILQLRYMKFKIMTSI